MSDADSVSGNASESSRPRLKTCGYGNCMRKLRIAQRQSCRTRLFPFRNSPHTSPKCLLRVDTPLQRDPL